MAAARSTFWCNLSIREYEFKGQTIRLPVYEMLPMCSVRYFLSQQGLNDDEMAEFIAMHLSVVRLGESDENDDVEMEQHIPKHLPEPSYEKQFLPIQLSVDVEMEVHSDASVSEKDDAAKHQ